jgi:pyruvate kinase
MGRYPVLAVEQMRRIAESTEAYLASLPAHPSPPRRLVESHYRTAALAHGVWTVAQDLVAKFIVVWSQQGGGARYLSQNNFCIPIIACTSDDRAARRMQLLRAVTPVRMNTPDSPAHFTHMVDAYLLETGWAAEGDTCILVAGGQLGIQGVTNSMAIHHIGDPNTGFAGRH